MQITKEQLTKDLAQAKKNQEQMMGNLNAQVGYVRALQDMLAQLEAPDPPPAKPADAQPV